MEPDMKERLDVLLVKQGLAPSREKAKAVIMSGNVFVDGEREDKAGAMFAEEAQIVVKENPLKCEYFLPFVVDELIREDRAEVKVLTSRDRWYGVTYKEDKPTVVQAVRDMKERGLYPEKLWGPEEVER